tara:strand:+ start:987 stop:1361 length:375 start_codon:yes stop_codon:yes gene_type:complete
MINKKRYYLELIQLIENNLLGKTNSSKSALKFFRSDSVSLELCYKLIKNYYLDKATNFEELYREMSHGSRQTIKTILDNAIAKKFLYVHKNKSDLRKRDIFIDKIYVKEFEKHIDQLKNKLNNI